MPQINEPNHPIKRKPYPSRWKRWTVSILLWLLLLTFLGGTFAFGAVTGFVAAMVKEDPVRSQKEIRDKIFENSITGFAYFADQKDGKNVLIGQLRADEDRRIVQLKEVPQHLIDAFLSTEDVEFYSHYGVNFKAIIRAGIQQVTHSNVQTGGSTITQQLGKIVFFSFEKTYKRKAKEILLALHMERLLSKQEILTAYLNKIPFGKGANGNNVYGVQAAAKGLFGLDVKDLNIAQSAYLAGIPQRPTAYSAFNNSGFDPEGFTLAKKRQALVLTRMLEEGKITKAQYDEASQFDLQASLAKPSLRAFNKYPFLMTEVEQRAAEILLEKENPSLVAEGKDTDAYKEALEAARQQLLTGGYKVTTTVDKTIYDTMQSIAKNDKNFTNFKAQNAIEQVGATLIDNKTGAILGMIEGRDFSKQQFNHTTAPRQPGSAMKPIAAYAPALDLGLIQPATAIDDVPIILPDGQKGQHVPINWDNRYHGLISARTALNQSYNIPAIKLFTQQVGIKKSLDKLKQMGITTLVPDDYYAQTGVIGGLKYGLTVEEITNAYSIFANGGTFRDAYLIDKIETSDGEVVFQHQDNPEIVFSEQASYLMTDMLKTVITNGTGSTVRRSIKSQIEMAGKTGTTSDNKDLWFVGYTPDVSLGVWIGYDQPKKLTVHSRPQLIWSKIINEVMKAKPNVIVKDHKFERPANLIQMQVCSMSGKLPTDLCRQANALVTDWFDKRYMPTTEDDVYQKANIVTVDGKEYIAKSTTPVEFTNEKIGIKRQPYTIPTNTDKPESYYKPMDAGLELPSGEDPRTDDGAAPSAPQNVNGEQNGDSVTITWSPNQEADIVGYRIYRSINNEPFVKMNSVQLGQPLSFSDKIDMNNNYSYQITAVDLGGNESQNSIPFTTSGLMPPIVTNPTDPTQPPGDGTAPPPTAPTAPSKVPIVPTGVTAKIGSVGIDISWQANPSADQTTSYNIYFSSDPNGKFELVGSASETSFTHVSLTPNKSFYKVSAVNSLGESELSPAVKAK